MTKVKTNVLELHELEHIDLKTITVDGKRYYTAEGQEDEFRYPSVTTVTGLYNKEQINISDKWILVCCKNRMILKVNNTKNIDGRYHL